MYGCCQTEWAHFKYFSTIFKFSSFCFIKGENFFVFSGYSEGVKSKTKLKPKRSGALKKELTEKEKLFCDYYSKIRNGREAAARSGFRFPEKTAAKLLKRKDILSLIAKNDKAKKSCGADIIAGYHRLAFGCVSDAVRLLFDDELTKDKIDGLDLFNVSEIKRQKGGAIEIKFFDRLKALEKLSLFDEAGSVSGGNSLYYAIEKSAAALSEEENE